MNFLDLLVAEGKRMPAFAAIPKTSVQHRQIPPIEQLFGRAQIEATLDAGASRQLPIPNRRRALRRLALVYSNCLKLNSSIEKKLVATMRNTTGLWSLGELSP